MKQQQKIVTDLRRDVGNGGALENVWVEEERNVNPGQADAGARQRGRGGHCGQGRVKDVGGARGGVLGLAEQRTLRSLGQLLLLGHHCKQKITYAR